MCVQGLECQGSPLGVGVGLQRQQHQLISDQQPLVLSLRCPLEADSEWNNGSRGGGDSVHPVLHTEQTGPYSHHLQGEADPGHGHLRERAAAGAAGSHARG